MTLSVTTLFGALTGIAVVGGLALAVAGCVGWTPSGTVQRRSRTEQRLRMLLSRDSAAAKAWWARGSARIAAAAVGGLLVWLFTSWPLGGLMTMAVVLGLPWLFNTGSGAKDEIARLEAVEEWVRRLSDIHTVGVSLEQSIQRSLETAPQPIRNELTLLVSRLTAGWQPQDAYRALADDLNDATADEVIALLILHVQDRGAGLSRALRDLAAALQHEVLMRREVEADREKPRTNDRWVTIFCLAIVGISVASGSYVEPFNTVVGNLVLVGLCVGFVLIKIWMQRLAVLEPAPRFLSSADHGGPKVKEPAA
ncbi:type II secretion system F family protein [Streptomyces sp. MZ04]|uniref:type II secretion system F family protein n=1 Tax=Streptomyces sp. MZ04 TaxID=2559236 RepID=UPI00107E96C0|nr:type II secretion system F family protein [Streptomyces sp. MZ04]TGB15515.1 secretion system protein [Streptomyces sp. MZ04]